MYVIGDGVHFDILPKIDGSHVGLPPSSIHRMTLGALDTWRRRYLRLAECASLTTTEYSTVHCKCDWSLDLRNKVTEQDSNFV